MYIYMYVYIYIYIYIYTHTHTYIQRNICKDTNTLKHLLAYTGWNRM